jgi:hypothetical protein
VIFLLERGRAYYPVPADSIAIAAGAVALVAWLRRWPELADQTARAWKSLPGSERARGVILAGN